MPTQRKLTQAEKAEQQATYLTALASQTETALACRSMRHAWEQSHSFRLINPATKRESPILVMEFQCSRGCGVVRKNVLLVKRVGGGRFEIVDRYSSVYTYPEGYQIKGASGVRNMTDVWQEVLRRQLDDIVIEDLTD